MFPGWWFAIASIIAVLGIVFFFKQMVRSVSDHLEKGEEKNISAIQSLLSRFFIKVAIAEVIPIILIIVGFVQSEKWTKEISTMAAYTPFIIVILTLLFGNLNVILSRGSLLLFNDSKGQWKGTIDSIIFSAMAVVSAIPIISIVGILTILP
jgi:hypothetical protein